MVMAFWMERGSDLRSKWGEVKEDPKSGKGKELFGFFAGPYWGVVSSC